MEPYNPRREGEIVARELTKGDAVSRLRRYGNEMIAHYVATGITTHNPRFAYFSKSRNVWRACLAPILYGIDRELERQVEGMRQQGRPLAILENREATHLDRIFRDYGSYIGRDLAFLRVAGVLSYNAALTFIKEVARDKNHWCRPAWDAFPSAQNDYALVASAKRLKIRQHPVQYLTDITVASNITALRVLRPAALHASLWQPGEGGGTEVMMQRIDQIGWPQSTGIRFFEEHFPDPVAFIRTPRRCPYEHDMKKIAEGSIWHATSLQGGPWPYGPCPASVTFEEGLFRQKASAATLRFASLVPVVSETLTP